MNLRGFKHHERSTFRLHTDPLQTVWFKIRLHRTYSMIFDLHRPMRDIFPTEVRRTIFLILPAPSPNCLKISSNVFIWIRFNKVCMTCTNTSKPSHHKTELFSKEIPFVQILRALQCITRLLLPCKILRTLCQIKTRGPWWSYIAHLSAKQWRSTIPCSNLWSPGRGQFCAQGHQMNKLGRSPLGDATYRISKL